MVTCGAQVCFYVESAAPPSQGGGAPASPKFLGTLCTPNRIDLSDEIWYRDTWESGIFLGVSHAPSEVGEAQRPETFFRFDLNGHQPRHRS